MIRPGSIRFIFAFTLAASFFILLPAARAERLPIKAYTSADGLGSSFINYLMRDSRGFLWFCTRDGLSRFDGARFVTYQVGNTNAPPSIEGITETRDGSYWITTTGGLYRFKRDAIPQPDATAGVRPMLNAEFVHPNSGMLFEDRNGNLWYGGGGFFHLEEKEGRVSFQEIDLKLPAASNPGVVRISESGDGSLWLDTTAGLVRRLPDGREIFYPIEADLRRMSGCT
jgi:ligand-binding sensor domain-containing protein